MSYDEVIEELGQFGRYQRRIYLLLCLPAISCALHKMSGNFLQAKAHHRCLLPWEASNASYQLEEEVLRVSYPLNSGFQTQSYSSCVRLVTNQTDSPLQSTVSCDKWVFDKTLYSNTVLMEWEVVCDRAWIRATSDALLMTGVMLGSIVFGDLSDRWGRRPIFFISLVMQVIFGVLVGVAPDMYTYMFSRLVLGSTTSGTFLVAYVLSMEMVGPKWRMIAGVMVQLFFTVGYMLTAAFAYFIQEWRTLQIALTLPGIAFFSYWWFVPESVRWLLTKGRYEEAKSLLRKVAEENKKPLSEQALEQLCTEAETDKKTQEGITGEKPSLLDLFRFPNLRRKSVIIFFLWFVNSGTYYGLSWNTQDLGGSNYINVLIMAAVEVPAYLFLMFTLDRWGRKLTLTGSMILGGVCLMTTVFLPESWVVVPAVAGKMAITASYGTVYVFSAEQFPTVIRNVGLGAASTSARVGGILAPYANLMAEYWKPLPLLIFGGLALLAGVSALSLPETLNKTLPDTIADGEQFGKEVKSVETNDVPLNRVESNKEALSS